MNPPTSHLHELACTDEFLRMRRALNSQEKETFGTHIVKAVFVYFTKHVDDVSGAESQLSLSEKKQS